MAFDTQITDLVGGTIDQVACDQWAADACKEIIHQLPAELKAKCSTVSTLNNSSTTLDMDGIGDILHVTRLSADSGGYQVAAREIPAQYGGLAEDSTDLNYYGTVTDPVYWVDSSSDVSTLKVKPTTTANQTSIVHHITYPTVDVSAVSVIANFPDEAEALVVLYAAVRQLLQYQSTMSSSFNTDIGTALTATNTELDETQAVCDKIDADLVLAKAEIVLAKAEAAELATSTDNSGDFETACDAMVTELDKVDDIINLANDEFDEVSTQVSGSKDSPITDAFTEFEKSDTILDKGEVDSESAVNDAAAKIVIELDDSRAICDDVGSSADSAGTALGNMATEIALANQEVDDALTEIAEAISLTDGSSSDIKTAVDGMKTAVSKFRADNSNPGLFGDAEWFTTGADVGMTKVKLAVDKAIAYIDGNSFHADYDLQATLGDVDTELTNEDIELAGGRMQQAQTQMNAVSTQLSIAQSHIQEWQATVQTLVSEINAFASEASARYGWINAKAVVWQGELSAAQGYMATAGGYANQASGFNSTAQAYATEVQARINVANGYIAEINVRLAQAGAKRQESQSRLAAGNAYLQEAQSTITAGNAYLQEAQGRISQAQGYAAEVNARSSFASAKTQAIQGHISTAQNYVATAQGFGTEVQTKIAIANGYIAEVNTRLTADNAKYQWYGDQYAKLTAEYARGLAALKGG